MSESFCILFLCTPAQLINLNITGILMGFGGGVLLFVTAFLKHIICLTDPDPL
jgi:hypothetical protein